MLSALSAVAHDIWSSIIRKGQNSDREEVLAAKVAALTIGAIAMAVAIIGGEGLNVSFMVGLAFAIAASANFPRSCSLSHGALQHGRRGDGRADRCHLRARTHHHQPDRLGRPSRTPDTGAFTWYDLNNPGLISIPLGFVGCIVGTLLSTERETEHSFHELHVRSETGLGAERAVAQS